ncbi:HNH endonuclease, partial [bacterium]|nr:HNH endonuclease [bacterium]
MFKTYDRCIFCFNELSPHSDGDGEHVIPRGVYGFWRIYDVCDECKEHFGDKIDQLALKNLYILNAIKIL